MEFYKTKSELSAAKSNLKKGICKLREEDQLLFKRAYSAKGSVIDSITIDDVINDMPERIVHVATHCLEKIQREVS